MTEPIEQSAATEPQVLPLNPGGKSSLQGGEGPLGFRELTEDELAEMDGDEPGTGMDAGEIDAFLAQEIAPVGPSGQPGAE